MKLIGTILKTLAPYIFQLFMHLLGWLKWWLDKNPDIRKKLDKYLIETVGPWFLKNISDANLMKLFGDFMARRAAADQARKKKAREEETAKAEPATEPTDEARPDDESDLVESAAETAKAGAKVARKYAGKAGKKTSQLLSRAGKWLREEVELDTEDEPADETPPEQTQEDEEIERLKRRLEEEGQAPPRSETPPAKAAPKKRPTDEDKERKPQTGYSEELKDLLDKERSEKDSDNH